MQRLMSDYGSWKAEHIKKIRNAIIDAAVGMTDDEINECVKKALSSARRMLSS